MLAALKKVRLPGLERGWLTGPIFDKELRVSSRRRRNYTLRFFYVLLLAVFVGVVWLSVVEYQGNAAFQQSRMAAAGKQITTTIVLFQFIATQILAVIMLSTAISDEIYHRTLGLLMTTPINSLQIVMGKVLSKLLQLIVLLAITLPMLAIVRVFGGVSWNYLLSSLFITLTAVIFAASLSLLLSIEHRRAYGVIIRSVFILAVLYFILPAAVVAVWALVMSRLSLSMNSRSLGPLRAFFHLRYFNPFFGIWETTRGMLSPGGGAGFYWPVHCAIMLGLSALIMGRAVAVVRRVALRQATGQLELSPKAKKKRSKTAASDATSESITLDGPVKRVHGPPVVWKELRAPLIQGLDNKNSYIGLAVSVLALLLTYLFSAKEGALDENFTHVSYALMFVLMGLIFTIVFSATRITAEKESQTWPILLATPLSDWDILLGKAASAFRRCLPIWGLLAGHVLVFVLVGYIHPVAVFHLLIVVTWLTCFITSAGLYFSTRFGRTTTAVVASFALTLGLWVVGPILAGLLSIVGNRGDPFVKYMWMHPAIQTELVMAGAGGRQNASLPLSSLEYGTERVIFNVGHEASGVGRVTAILIVRALVYIFAGLLFFWRAKCRLRRHVF